MVLRFIYLIAISMIISIWPNDIFGLDSNHIFQTIIDIYDYNDDQSLDTLIGKSNLDMIFVPTKIIWGKDTTVHPNPITYPKVIFTSFNYSQWENLNVSFMFGKFNRDTISDIIFISSGKIRIDSVTTKDTSTAIILFGQCGLDTISDINLNTILMNQSFPYKARHLVHGNDFRNCELRGEPYRTYYELPKIDDVLIPPPLFKHACPGCGEQIKITANIYPIPSKNNINIEFNGLEQGEYQIQIVDLTGRLILEKKFIVNHAFHKENIFFKDILTGTYLMLLSNEERTIHSQKFLISQ
ncbi:MAG TPA: T9SS type A sorting domain-containing protein [Candidatus Kapabacteria bacterium]|nr:T9SS type A sorting domain-containing protein [Candidatus Kapabacteria bacterium]